MMDQFWARILVIQEGRLMKPTKEPAFGLDALWIDALKLG